MEYVLPVAVAALLLGGCAQVASFPDTADAAVAPTGWTVIAAGTANLYAVAGTSDTDVWIVGDSGTILHWNGMQLSPDKSGTTATLRGVWAVDTNTVYAVGDGGVILKHQGGLWSLVGGKVTQQVLTAVWADTQRVVAVGSAGTIVLGTSTGYNVLKNIDTQSSLPITANLFGVAGSAGGTVVVVGSLGVLEMINGSNVATPPPINGYSSKLLSAVAVGSSSSFLVGQQGAIFSGSAGGTSLSMVPGCPQSALRSVSVSGSLAWAAGWDGTICKITNTAATWYPYTDTRWFNGIYASSPTTLWVVGASGTVLHGLPTQSAQVDAGVGDVGGVKAGGPADAVAEGG